jgi:uncharacterized membrane protein
MFGLELHPAVVHFPIALTTVGAVAAVVYGFFRKEWLRWYAPILLTLALLGAGASYFSGKSSEDRAEKLGVPEAPMEEHEESSLWALGATGLACLLSWATHARGRGVWVAALLALLAFSTMLRTGHLGGKLVYMYGAGRVPAPAGQPAPAAGVEHESGEGSGDRD